MEKIVSFVKFILLLICLFTCNFLYGQARADTIRTGVYLKALFDFNSTAFSYNVDFWIWFTYTSDSLRPLESVEIANAKNYQYYEQSLERRSNKFWAAENCKATINQNWDLTQYPFDNQKLEIVIEEGQFDVRKAILVADKSNFDYNDQIDIKGWRIDSSTIKKGTSHYKSDFGDPTLNGQSDYSKVYYSIFLSRNSWPLFFKLLTGCYVAFLVSFLVFFIKPIYVDPRFGLSIGGLFAAIGNKYVVDSNMPESISFTLVDKIHVITFVYILATIFFSLVSLKIYDSNKIRSQKTFDKLAALFVFGSYAIINLVLIVAALR